MPQEIRVLCCCKCKMYQVDIVKKTNKWQCKMCQEKQSVFKEFFRGSGAECRLKVQELNFNTNTKQTEVENEFLSLLDRDDLDIDLESILNVNNKKVHNPTGQLKIQDSKWTKYVDVETQHKVSQDIEPTEPPSKLKRKPNSTSLGSEIQCAKNPRTSTTSKWDKFL